MTVSTEVLGPGTLTIGETGTPIDASCLVNNCEDHRLQGPGRLDHEAVRGRRRRPHDLHVCALTGNVDQDLATATGLHALSWNSAGTSQPFTFTPNTDVGATATWDLTIDPLEFGGDEMGADMTSDFEWTCTGKPTIVYGIGAAGDDLAADDGTAA